MKNVCVCECVLRSERVVAIIEEVASVRKCLQRANSCFASRQTDYTVKRKLNIRTYEYEYDMNVYLILICFALKREVLLINLNHGDRNMI